MAWFRTHRGMAAWLAFFALACQLALTFGHVHVGGAGQRPAVETTGTGNAPPAPPQDPLGDAGDSCALCANISLAGALILPVLALLLGPAFFTIQLFVWSVAAPAPASCRHRPFSARGPPHA